MEFAAPVSIICIKQKLLLGLLLVVNYFQNVNYFKYYKNWISGQALAIANHP